MSRIDYRKTPFPWFGGKSRAASTVWAALGDVQHYVEPFFGGGAVLLRRPHLPNRPYYSETVNDLDGLLVNFWRAVQWEPQAVAEHASWPVTEADKHARHIAILEWINSGAADRLAGSWDYYDPVIAGWWVWGVSVWIGGGFASGNGAWTRDPETGKLVRRTKEKQTGTSRKRSHLVSNGQGVIHSNAREPGISRQIPCLGDNGQGVIHANAREPGVQRQIPHLSDDGQGVNHHRVRETGVEDETFNPEDDEREANARAFDACDDPQWFIERDYAATGGYHPMTMPEVRRWMAWLSARLRHVRIVNGDWKRVCKPSVIKTLEIRTGKGVAGVFLDPPYAHDVRDRSLYRVESDIAAEVREWCIRHGDDPQVRIVLAGFAGEGHEILTQYGWREVEWFEDGWLTGGMANTGDDEHQMHRERLWLSPHCLRVDYEHAQLSLFGDAL